MSDLIDRKAILKNIEKIRQSVLMLDDTHRAGIIMTGMHLCEEAVRNQTAAQPEVIRCKDCSKRPYCKMSTAWAVVPDDDWFCGDAERNLEEIQDTRGGQE